MRVLPEAGPTDSSRSGISGNSVITIWGDDMIADSFTHGGLDSTAEAPQTINDIAQI